jgi:hypothetical protein
VYRVSFVYGVAVLAPWNAVLSTLDFFTASTPNYPISFVVSFAINGVMVVVVLLCIAYPEKGTHCVKVNLTFFLTGLCLILLPLWVNFTKTNFGETCCFWLTVASLVLLGAMTAVS